jgi:CBS domain-containing protein
MTRTQAPGPDTDQLREPTVGDLMTPDPVSIEADAPLIRAENILRDLGVGGLPVVNASGALVGVLSRTDLLAARWDEGLSLSWPGLRVRYLMTSPGITAPVSMSVRDAAGLMERHGIHRLIIIGEDGRTPVGIFSTSDMVRAVAGSSRESVARHRA